MPDSKELEKSSGTSVSKDVSGIQTKESGVKGSVSYFGTGVSASLEYKSKETSIIYHKSND
uniref:Uncharacterized protein n=1 Tax=Octopus bimaculoides TaxID=37653 RepID=A0A0L8HAL4_OCTBM